MAHASTTRSFVVPALGSALLSSLHSCYIDDPYHDYHHGPGVYYVTESEPNNLAGQANYVGFLEPAETFVIEGSVAGIDGNGPDGVDGFEFSSPGGVHVTFQLDSVDNFGDLDVCLYDPDLGSYVACWESPAADEFGEFWVDGYGSDYQLVVIAANAASAYSLAVSADFYYYAATTKDEERGLGASELRVEQEFALEGPTAAAIEKAATRLAVGDYAGAPRVLKSIQDRD